uniref:NADH-ubiquinone oxidoreductase chain 3 n=1 Tax=Cypridopsis vidua TaxID=230730 RepID=A0A0N7ATF3_9CRUS|nr:NADH dehydrogenase subunit 3 [Cypridopsis vidua]AJY78606.1 NADH dehydrogenase subunit 3 [Cypridopsis vidua]
MILTLFSLIILITAIAMIIILFASLISKSQISDREKTSPFECGFDPFSNSRIPFSLRFYMITIIFLIFDVEIAILLPLPLTNIWSNSFLWWWISCIFILTLIIGLIHEWNYGSLDWSS